MIVLDTHMWVWWVHDNPQLTQEYKKYIDQNEQTGIGVSAISCWEIAKLVEYGRLVLPVPINDWFDQALAYPGVRILELTPQIAIDSTQLPPPFHKDPADQIIVATARVYQIPLVTVDGKIRQYQHVLLAP